MNKYREEFEKETNCPWINSQGEPDIDYVEYLEFKLEQAEKDRETIFKEELEEKLPNVREQADKYQQSTANKMGIERRAFEAGAKWLIQYLKK